MAKKQREKEKLFEDVQFQDVERAKREVKFAKINQIRILVGFIIAVISTIFTAIAIWGNAKEPSLFWLLAGFFAIVAYLIGGGIFKALKVAGKITKIGWFIIPVFPADVLIAIACFIFSVVGLLFLPIIFVGINYVQHKKTLDAATSYLAQCGYEAETVTSAE